MSRNSRSASRSPKRRPVSARLHDLAQPTDRVEFLDTPAGYHWEDTRDNRKIPFVFRTSERFPPTPPPFSESLECNLAAVEPKPHVAVIADAPRWPPDSTEKIKQYDVEKGLRALEAKTFAATFATSQRPEPKVASSHMPNQEYLTIAHTRHVGGKFTGERRNTEEHFVIRRQSPGPIYAPKFTAVDPKPTITVFSSQPREPPVKSLGPGPLAYADSVAQTDNLSTHRKAPCVRIGAVPNSSSMPFPYTMQNFCNSRSMRTKFCKSYAVLDRHTQKKPANSTPVADDRPRLTNEPPKDTSGSIRRFVDRTRAATPSSCGRCAPWESPFSKLPLRAKPIRNVVNAETLLRDDSPLEVGSAGTYVDNADRAANANSRPATALGYLVRNNGDAVHMSGLTAPHSVAAVNRFAFARKFPQLRQDDATLLSVDDTCHADGVMADIIAEARRTHPESGWQQLSRPPSGTRVRRSTAGTD